MIRKYPNRDIYIYFKFFHFLANFRNNIKGIDMTLGRRIKSKRVNLAHIIKTIALGKNSDPLYCSEHGDRTDFDMAVTIGLFFIRIKIWIKPHT